MKKAYTTPTILITWIQAEAVLAASNGFKQTLSTKEVDGTAALIKDESSAADSEPWTFDWDE